MKGGILMRVLFCKIQCPFICFCKPSSAHHLYASGPGPLKLENRSHVVAVVPSSTKDDFSVSGISSSENVVHKSCLRKKNPCGPDGNNLKEAQKKTVQWIDFSGKELAQIKEFESSETEDTDDEGERSQRCLCSIL